MISVTGCPNAWKAQYQIADIGLTGTKGQWEGEKVDAYDLYVGGCMGEVPDFGLELVQKVPAPIVQKVLRRSCGITRPIGSKDTDGEVETFRSFIDAQRRGEIEAMGTDSGMDAAAVKKGKGETESPISHGRWREDFLRKRTADKPGLDWSAAMAHLRDADPLLAEIIQRVGPCTVAPRKGYFLSLCKAIISQQISTKAANSVTKKFKSLFPAGRPTPAAVAKMTPQKLRTAGCIVRQKAAYLREIAKAFVDGAPYPVRRLPRMSDEEAIETLIQIKGVGRWTAEMFLIFVLCRENVYPIDDLGLQVNAGKLHCGERLRGDELIAVGEKWHPYRSIATWYLHSGSDYAAEETPPRVKAKRIAVR